MKNISKKYVQAGEYCYYIGKYGFAIFKCVGCQDNMSCKRCFFYDKYYQLRKVCAKTYCLPLNRHDGRYVIFVKKIGIMINISYICNLIYGKLRKHIH